MKRLTGKFEAEPTGEYRLAKGGEAYLGQRGQILIAQCDHNGGEPSHILRVTSRPVETEIAPPSGADAVRLAHLVKILHETHHGCPFEDCGVCYFARNILDRAKAAEPATAVMVEPTPDATVAPEPDPAAELRAAIEKARGNHALNHHTPLFSDCGHPHCRLASAAEAYLKGAK